MARTGITAAMQTASKASLVKPFMLVAFNTDGGYVRVWSGMGDLIWDGNTYQGIGEFSGISDIEETPELKATGITVFLSGIPSTLVAIALANLRQGMPADVWIGAMDTSTGLIVADPYLLFSGKTDIISLDDQGNTAQISVTFESLEIDRIRSRVRRYTPEDQKLIDDNDRGFEYVAELQDKQVRWGN